MTHQQAKAFSDIAALLVLLACGICRGGGPQPVPLGTYASVSESEWSIALVLKNGGRANIVQEAWLAGNYDSREVKSTEAAWTVESDRIRVEYEGVQDFFHFRDDVSLSELGINSVAPGLTQLEPISPSSRVGGVTLWLEPHGFGSND